MTALVFAATSAALLASMLAATATGGGGSDIAPWLSGGGAAAAVACLAYIARQMANGRLIAREVAIEQEQLKELIAKSLAREDAAAHREEAASQREELLRNLLVSQVKGSQ